MFPPWLMGVGCYKFCRVHRLPRRAGWLLFGASLLLLAGYQLIPHSTLQPFMPFSLTPARLLSTAQGYFLAGVFSMNESPNCRYM